MSPQSTIPFSRDEFLRVFAAYNHDIWPGQIILYLVGVACLVLVFLDHGEARRTALALLGGLWLWMAVTYHMLYFTRINPAAWGFGAMFAVEAGLVFAVALGRRPRKSQPPLHRSIGAVIVLYAMVIYPILGAVSDHAYPQSPTFGAPCPTTIFTFGLLLLITQRVPWWLFVIPTLWAMFGATAPFMFGIWEDFGLVVAAVAAVAVKIAHSRRGGGLVRIT